MSECIKTRPTLSKAVVTEGIKKEFGRPDASEQTQHELADSSGSQASNIPLCQQITTIYLLRLLHDGVFYDCNHTLMCINVFKFFLEHLMSFVVKVP